MQTESPSPDKKNEKAGDGNTPDTPQAAPETGQLAFSRQEWMKLFVRGQHGKLCAEMLLTLKHFVNNCYWNLKADNRALINEFVENFLFFFCHPEFQLPRESLELVVKMQPLIANVVAISDFGTTTPWVSRLARSNENFFKLLVLHNVRSAVEIDPRRFFDVSPFLASEWWSYYWTSAAAFCTKETHERILAHLDGLDDRFEIFGENMRASFFPVTYVAPEKESAIKGRLNKLVKKAFSNVSIANKPDRRKIALITGRWHRSAVYTSLAPLVKSLAGRYEITLVHHGQDTGTILDKEMFARMICVTMKGNRMDLSVLQDNPFSAVIYPDVGMSGESIYLSNIRIAPVQAVMYGHPTSTWHSEIDYFIGGQRVEDRANAAKNYSERLVLIPGMGVYPVFPDDFALPAGPPADDPLLINCGWTAQKVSYPLLCALQKILAQARRRVVFQIFPGVAIAHHNNFIPFVKDVFSMLGPENVHVYPRLSRFDYLGQLCKGALSIDSYPFGGFNTVVDALYCKKPMVVWKGERAFNRFGAATLETIGAPELIATTAEDYIATIVRLINDNDYRAAMTAKIASVDLKGAFASQENPDNFRKAIDYLIENNDRLKAENSREPIIIV
jgi:hypothetical protein